MAKHRKTASNATRVSPSTVSSRHATPSSSKTPSFVSSQVSTTTIKEEDGGEDEEEEVERPARKRQPFRFFDLAPEIRLQILEDTLHITAFDVLSLYEGKKKARQTHDLDERPAPPLDLEPNINWYLLRPRLNIFLVSRRMHDEAYRVFYSQPMRLFPMHGRFFNTKKPLLSRIPPRYRAVLHTMELKLGPGWSKPPRSQNTEPSLGLRDCTNLRTLKIFVECDPSDGVFNGFRGANATEETYKLFCVDLLRGIIEQVPTLKTVEIDAYPGVKQDAPLVHALRRTSENAGKQLLWGPLRKWEKHNNQPGLVGLEDAMKGLGLSNEPRFVEAQA